MFINDLQRSYFPSLTGVPFSHRNVFRPQLLTPNKVLKDLWLRVNCFLFLGLSDVDLDKSSMKSTVVINMVNTAEGKTDRCCFQRDMFVHSGQCKYVCEIKSKLFHKQ